MALWFEPEGSASPVCRILVGCQEGEDGVLELLDSAEDRMRVHKEHGLRTDRPLVRVSLASRSLNHPSLLAGCGGIG